MLRKFLIFAAVCATVFSCVVPAHADPIEGLWYTEGREGGVQLYKCDDEICGRLYWLKDSEENGDVSRDIHNRDSEKRSRPICELQFMGGFKPEEKGLYDDGWIYSPRHGADFSAEMTLVDPNTLHLRGYLIFPFLGQTQTWKRAKKMPHCSMTAESSSQ